VAVVAPLATSTDAGTLRLEGAALTRATADPPLGAADESVTWHVVEPDAARVEDVQASEESVNAGFSVKVTVFDALFSVAVTTAVFETAATDAAVKVAEVAPAGTMTDAGTVREAGWLLVTTMAVPPAGAALEIVTLQTVVAGTASVALVHTKDEIVNAGFGATLKFTVRVPFNRAVTSAV